MTEHPSVTDWITAAATGTTAIAATIAGFVAWLAFRRDSRNQLPIIEAEFGFDSQSLTRNYCRYLRDNKTAERGANF